MTIKRNSAVAARVRRRGKRDGCYKCGRKEAIEAAHIQALMDGGADTEENMVALCEDCHRGFKGVNLTKEYLDDPLPHPYGLMVKSFRAGLETAKMDPVEIEREADKFEYTLWRILHEVEEFHRLDREAENYERLHPKETE